VNYGNLVTYGHHLVVTIYPHVAPSSGRHSGPTTDPRATCSPQTGFLMTASFLSIDCVYVATGNFN